MRSRIFSDSDIELYDVETAKKSTALGCGRLELYADRLVLPTGITIPKEEISGMALQGAMKLYVSSADGRHFQLRPKKKGRRCMNKYLTACSMLGAAVGTGV